MPRGIPKVALLIETSLAYGRGLLRGVVRYARLHGPWSFYITPGDLDQVLPRMEEWGGTGIIARIATPQTEAAILASGLPFVALDLRHDQLASSSRLTGACEVCPDSHLAARMAAEHLLEKGFRQFAFVGAMGQPPWSTRREEGFVERLREAGHACQRYPLPSRPADGRWGREQRHMSQWLQNLAKPMGVLACDDDRGRQVLEAARSAGLCVPDQLAVIGVDNDELLCELSDPPLSSVKLDLERGGYEAAALLDGLMSGRLHPPQRVLVRPQYVVARRSTDVVAAEDPLVAEALRFIADHAGRPMGVAEVVRQLGCSRRALELRFRRSAGRSLLDEIQRSRLERAKRLLSETDLSVGEVAAAAGYASGSYLTRVFRQHCGMSPGRYRQRSAGQRP